MECDPCSENCYTCSGTTDTCTSCWGLYFLDLNTHECVFDCKGRGA